MGLLVVEACGIHRIRQVTLVHGVDLAHELTGLILLDLATEVLITALQLYLEVDLAVDELPVTLIEARLALALRRMMETDPFHGRVFVERRPAHGLPLEVSVIQQPVIRQEQHSGSRLVRRKHVLLHLTLTRIMVSRCRDTVGEFVSDLLKANLLQAGVLIHSILHDCFLVELAVRQLDITIVVHGPAESVDRLFLPYLGVAVVADGLERAHAQRLALAAAYPLVGEQHLLYINLVCDLNFRHFF